MFIIAPFLNWLTILSFVVIRGFLFPEFSEQPNLWAIAGGNAGIAVSQALATFSLTAAILLITSGILGVRYEKLGVLGSCIGLASFVLGSYSLFGNNQTGSTLLITSPGVGVPVVIVGIVVAVVSTRSGRKPLELLFPGLKTREGLARSGLFLASVPLAIDGLNHAALGQLSAFLGISIVEEILHLGFLFSVVSLLVLFAFRHRLALELWPKRLIGVAFLFLLLDGAYHSARGELFVFLGHNPAEIILHLFTYYGVALTIIALHFLTQTGESNT